ncbi:MAG: ATP-binding protein [Desulfitobacteriaceae bacterium]
MTLLILIVLGGLVLVITWLFGDFYTQLKLDALRSEAVQISVQLTAETDWNERLALLRTFNLTSGTQLVLLDPHGGVMAMTTTFEQRALMGPIDGVMGMNSGVSWVRTQRLRDFLNSRNLTEVLSGKNLSFKTTPVKGSGSVGTTGSEMLIAAAPLGLNPVQGVVLLGSSPMPIEESINTFRRLVLYAAFLAVFLATIFSLIFARQVTRPLALMQRAAGRMAEGDFQPIEGVNSQDELGELVRTLNTMGENLSNHMNWLAQEKNQLQAVVEGISDPVVMLSTEGKLLFANEPAKALWEGNDSEQETRQTDILGFLVDMINELKGAKETHILNLGTQILDVGIAPLTDFETIPGHVVVLRDVTSSLRAEKERRDFLASVTHELRTPLHLIQGYLEAIEDGVIPQEEQSEKLDLVLEEAKRLARLVNDLQDMNGLAHKHYLQLQKLDLEEFFQDLEQRFSAKAKLLGINLKFAPVDGEKILVDRDRFLQVFINLLDNACRHTPHGQSVQVWLEHGDGQIRLAVKDEGEGISEATISHIFEPFYRVDKARSRKDGGLGLGLAIVRQIVESHGGRVYVESTIGQGSTFWVELPINLN